MRPVSLFLFLAASLVAQPASVEGTVVDKSTGRPLSSVQIHLISGDFAGGGNDSSYGATSDRDGRFSVTDMKPGSYLVLLERTGFVQVQPAGAVPVGRLALKPGQHLTDHRLEMTPRALIAGRVVDEYGDPVQGVVMHLQTVLPDRAPESTSGRFAGTTDDRGEFRILTAPGKYYLQASPPNFSRGGPEEIRADGTSTVPLAPTYYPSAAATNGAAVVQAAPGQDIAGLEVRLLRGAAPARGLAISGVVTGMPEGARANVIVLCGSDPERPYDYRSTAAGPDGKFSIAGLQPAFCKVVAQYSLGKIRLQSQVTELHITGSGETNVQLHLVPGEEINGTLEFAGDAQAAPAGKFTVHLNPADTLSYDAAQTTPGQVDKDGSFRIPDVLPGRFRARVEPLPENAYIRSVTLNGAVTADSILDFSRGAKGSRVKITVNRNGGQLSGNVLGRDGEPLASSRIMVMLWKDPKQNRSENNRVAEGRYSVKALRPGKYRLLAIDTFDLADVSGASGQDEVLNALLEAAEEIEIKEGDRMVKDLKVVGKESIHVKPKQ